MNLLILDSDFEATNVVDVFKSLIWTDRYYECGDFEISTYPTIEDIELFKQDYYLYNANSDRLMIIEKIQISSDVEEGSSMIVSGRSLESILDRRVLWNDISISGNLQLGIKSLITDNIISPSKPERKIDNFIFEDSTDPRITVMAFDAQYKAGDNLYDIIVDLCKERSLGFKVTLNASKQFVFKLYLGEDRSYEQDTNDYVIFSPNFDNLISSNYIESKSSYKNVCLVGGDGEGTARKFTAVGNTSGLERREMFTEASSISSDEVSATQYTAQLVQKGREDLAQNTEVVTFEGEADTATMFVYGQDFFIGDIVQISNEYGHENRVRVLELVISEDESGYSSYPTFSTMQHEEYETLNYIASTGTQYVDLELKPTNYTRVISELEVISGGTDASFLYGCRSTSSQTDSKAFTMLLPANSTTSLRSDYFGSSKTTSVTATTKIKIDQNKNVISITGNGVSASIIHSAVTTDVECDYNLYLFAINNAGAYNRPSKIKLYSCKVYENNTLIRDLVPSKNSDGTVGLHCKVTGLFFTNKGTGIFGNG